MELVRNDLAVFTAKSGRTVEFIPWPSDVEWAPSYWSIWAYDGSLRDMMQFFRRHVPWHPYREPPSGMIASITFLVGIVATTAIYLALWVGLSALPDPGWAAIPLACVLIAIIPFCTGLLSPSLVAIVIPLVGQVTGTLIFFSTPWFGGCCFSNLVYDSLMPLFVYFVGGPLFLVYLPFAVGRALR